MVCPFLLHLVSSAAPMWPAARTCHFSTLLVWPPAPQGSSTATANLLHVPALNPSSLGASHTSSSCSETIAGSHRWHCPWSNSWHAWRPSRLFTHISQDSALGLLPSNPVDLLPWNVAGPQAEPSTWMPIPEPRDASESDLCSAPSQHHLPPPPEALGGFPDGKELPVDALACPSTAFSAVDSRPRYSHATLPNGHQSRRGHERHSNPRSALLELRIFHRGPRGSNAPDTDTPMGIN